MKNAAVQSTWFGRFQQMMLMSACLVHLATSNALAQPKAAKKAPAGEDKTLVTKTGLNLRVTYFRSTQGESAPVVILLHGKGGNRLVWKNFATRLQQEQDFAVVTVDLSGHGESGSRAAKPAGGKKADAAISRGEYQAMVADDLETVKRFLMDEHQKGFLNISKLAIGAADFSTAVAIAYADFDWNKKRYDDAPIFAQQTPRGEDVRALILLSPEENAPGLTISQSLTRLRARGVQVMIGVSKDDKPYFANAKKVYEHLAPKKVDPEQQYVYLVEYDGKLRGTDLLNRGDQKVETNMLNFLDKHVKPLPIEWRDRRSLLERDDDTDDKGK